MVFNSRDADKLASLIAANTYDNSMKQDGSWRIISTADTFIDQLADYLEELDSYMCITCEFAPYERDGIPQRCEHMFDRKVFKAKCRGEC